MSAVRNTAKVEAGATVGVFGLGAVGMVDEWMRGDFSVDPYDDGELAAGENRSSVKRTSSGNPFVKVIRS